MDFQLGNGYSARQQGDRSCFWVSPPEHYLINRRSPKAMPHNLSVVVGVDPKMVEPKAFLQPVAPLNNNDDCVKNNDINDHAKINSTDDKGRGCDGPPLNEITSYMSGRNIPLFFTVQVYVWDDTTLREILEEVLESSAAAKRALLPPAFFAAANITRVGEGEGRKLTAMTGHVGAEKAVKENDDDNCDAEAKNRRTMEDLRDDISKEKEFHAGDGDITDEDDDDDGGEGAPVDDDGGDVAPVTKRERGETKNSDELRRHLLRDREGAKKRKRRQSLLPVAKVHVYHVFTTSGNEPQIKEISVVRVDRPVFHVGDYITMQELRNSKFGRRGWKNGDLLVFTPTVRHYKF